MFNTTSKQADDGVSPVIGVILMVAITVILAAVIGTFVLDLAGNLQQSAQASVTFDEDANSNDVVVQAVSMQSADFVEIRKSATAGSASFDSAGADAGGTAPAGPDGTAGNADDTRDLGSVGSSMTISYSGTDPAGSITVVGYLEGEGSVLQTYDYGG